MEIHLDLVGGLAGDMFVAALLDAFPALEPGVAAAIESFSPAHSRLHCTLHAHHDDLFVGRRFEVHVPAPPVAVPFAPGAAHAGHAHTPWRTIREQIRGSSLRAGARTHALGIFGLLAQAEGDVHGVAPDEVTFHEVGAWDSIADVVGAAVLIDALGATHWSCSPVPLGAGRAPSAHGIIPLPAPATARLLIGLPTHDDGIAGERITPTGAAILRYLCPPPATTTRQDRGVRCLTATGFGFGTRRLPGISNCVRALCFRPQAAADAAANRRIHVLEFEVDDQSGEDLAMGLERLRAHPGVLDVTQGAVFGKKGRMMVHVQVLARETHAEDVIEQCFRETTTIGLRRQVVHGVGLTRQTHTTHVEGHAVRVKVVERPGGATAKTEAEDVRALATHAGRARVRAAAEAAVTADA